MDDLKSPYEKNEQNAASPAKMDACNTILYIYHIYYIYVSFAGADLAYFQVRLLSVSGFG